MTLTELIIRKAEQIKAEADVDPDAALREHWDSILAIGQLNELNAIAQMLAHIVNKG